jgi:hypothetical protein
MADIQHSLLQTDLKASDKKAALAYLQLVLLSIRQ